MTDTQTDVSRPSALPSATLRPLVASQQPHSDQKSSSEYLDAIEEEWNKKVDMDVETLVDGMVDIVALASVSRFRNPIGTIAHSIPRRLQIKTNLGWHTSRFRLNREPNPW